MFKKGQRITYEGRTGVLGKKSTQFGKPGYEVKWDNGWPETIVTVERLASEMSKVAIEVFQEFGVVKNIEQDSLNRASAKPGTYIIDQHKSLGIIKDNLGFGFVVDWLGIGEVPNPEPGKAITYNWERDSEAIGKLAITPLSLIPQTVNDEIQFVNEEHKTMTTFQFSETARISEQIAQLQKQLDQLTASLQPYRECEQKAEELRLQVAEYGHEMTAKGIPQNDILTWAKSLYSAASGTEFVVGDSSTIAAQNQVIAELKTELTTAQKRYNRLLAERQEAMTVLENATAQRDKALAKITSMTAGQLRVAQKLKSLRDERQQLIEANASLLQRIQELEALSALNENVQQENEQVGEGFSQQAYTKILSKDDIVQTDMGEVGTVNGFAYGNIIVKLVNGEFNFKREQLKWISTPSKENKSHNFHPGDRVEVKDVLEDDDLGYLLHKQGTVVGVKGNNIAVLFDATDNSAQHETVLSACHLVAARHPDKEPIGFVVARDRGRKFIESIKSKAGMNNVTWPVISKVCLGSFHAFEEINLAATTKYQKELVEKLPTLMSDYILETGDITDFGWVDKTFKSKVEALLEAKKSLPYHSNDWVRVIETGEIWQVRSFDGEWLSVKQDNKIASLHKSEVELIKSEVAA
ncbi:hypothetical protein NIES592_08050 [Fischerella major NIES-592]|uniref:Uncharacterized protein n=1 Tax=Fischerella major NIES-592 TaxID=210994 RepID=A0A1U7H1E8_9CYAN|nr:hypothetical protein [Fischerella major]OKH14819.1 hypothetical protein NIES592_08050 [Fischerella major NIES-592]